MAVIFDKSRFWWYRKASSLTRVWHIQEASDGQKDFLAGVEFRIRVHGIGNCEIVCPKEIPLSGHLGRLKRKTVWEEAKQTFKKYFHF